MKAAWPLLYRFILICLVPTFAAAQSGRSIVDFIDPVYGGKIHQLRQDGGHEHNLYYYRDPWNADATRMIGIQSGLDQKNWRVCLYDGDGQFLKALFPIFQYDWRLCWDLHDPDLLYTFRGAELYRFHVASGKADLLKSFAPLTLMPHGPSLNQAGDRILVSTSDKVIHTFHLPEMNEVRSFKPAVPAGSFFSWDKPHYTGYKNVIDTAYSSADPANQAIVFYDDTGAVVHTFDGIGGGGHYDTSCDGKLAYFKLAGGPRGQRTPFEIHVVNLDGKDDRVLFSLPGAQAHFQNLHLSWPRKRSDWFIASFFPMGEAKMAPANAETPAPRNVRRRVAGSTAATTETKSFANNTPRQARVPRAAANAGESYSPPWDEIMMLKLDGTTKYLARTGTTYSRAAGRGGQGDMFWAQTLGRPSADGSRICFNSNRSGTIDLCILYTE